VILHNTFVSTSRVKAFVRETLKCGCPESVFDDVRIGLSSLYDTHGVAGGIEMLVGRRLLVAVVPFEGIVNPDSDIPMMLERGRRVRDDNAFNRYRLVIVGAHDADRRAQLESLSSAFDDRIHVHFIGEHEL